MERGLLLALRNHEEFSWHVIGWWRLKPVPIDMKWPSLRPTEPFRTILGSILHLQQRDFPEAHFQGEPFVSTDKLYLKSRVLLIKFNIADD